MVSSSMSCSAIDDTFGPHAQGCRGGFDFTLFFEQLFLTILPLVPILIAAPFRLIYLSKRQKKVVQSPLLYLKLTSYAIYWALTLVLLLGWASTKDKSRVSITASAVTLGAYSVIAVLSYAEHVKTIRPSLLLNSYLLFSLLFDIAQARTLWLRHVDSPLAKIFTACVALKCFSLILEALEKQRILEPQFKGAPPEEMAGVYNRSFFWWLNSLFLKGYSNTLSVNDLFGLDKHLASDYLHHLLESSWAKVTKRTPHALFFSTISSLKWPLLSAVTPRLSLTAFTYCQPFLLNRAITLSQQPITKDSDNDGYGLIGAYILVYVGIAVATGQSQHLTYRLITMVRGGLISMLYSKTGDLSITAVDPSSSMILMSADIERITTGWQTIHELWASIIEVGLAIYLLQRQLGASCAVPIGVALASMGGSIAATQFIMSRQAMWLEAIERRIAATTAMLGSMKGVKMSGLTDVLSETLHGLRKEEMRISKKFRRLLIWNMGLAYITPIAAPVLTFAVFSTGGSLNTAQVFMSLSLFTLLSEPLQALIMALATFMGAVGSFARIQEFLTTTPRVDGRERTSELDSILRQHEQSKKRKLSSDTPTEKSDSAASIRDDSPPSPPSNSDAIVIQAGSFGWDEKEKPLLDSINMVAPRDKLTMIVGPVGCGKSTLLKAILGEITILGGTVDVLFSEIAFCDQTPWHMNGTIREGIIGMSGIEEKWYNTVVRACALDADLRQLPLADQTPIGSKGFALSGGQSQRIALARAIYARKDLVILDDVLSGLDATTENAVFHNLLGTNGLLRKYHTTVLMTSSSAKRLPHADYIVSLDNHGQVSEQGTFKQLSLDGGYVSSFSLPPPDWRYDEQSMDTHNSNSNKEFTDKAEVCQPVDDASRTSGDVSVYLYYIKAVGWIPTLVFVVSISIYVFCQSFPTIWVKWWSAANAEHPNERLAYYLGIYGLLGALALVFLIVSCWQLIITMVPRSGERFHWVLLKTVLGAPMSFFSSTDIGVTINRFSQDLMLIDMELPVTALNTFATLVLCLAQMILIGVASTYAAVSFPIILISLYFIQKFYLRTSRQLRLLDLESKSPLYSQFIECLNGLATVRAFGWQGAMEEKNGQLLDQSQKPFYLLFAIQRWLTLVLDLVVAAIAVMLIIFVVMLRGHMSPGFTGVALLNVIMFSQSIKLLLTFWTNLETHIGSIARVKAFTATTESEHLPAENQTPPPSWPSQGAIEFTGISAEYKASEPVLKNVSLSIKAGEKVGICGRTGSGKSSLVSSIFRMIELTGGCITIDGLDISTIPREIIRSRIVGVPQDAYLLDGSVRLNIDPREGSGDEAIIDALRTVQLWENIKSKGGLGTDIEKIFLSHGQKQLFCLARALLRPTTILILDEATSSVDADTDKLMQQIIRERFSRHTIISVAHKLDTILDFDKVLILDEGVFVEFDSPHELLSDQSSAFHSLYYGADTSNSDGDFSERITLSDD